MIDIVIAAAEPSGDMLGAQLILQHSPKPSRYSLLGGIGGNCRRCVRINDDSANALASELAKNTVICRRWCAFAIHDVHYGWQLSFNGKQRVVELPRCKPWLAALQYAAGLDHAGRRQRESVARSLRQSACRHIAEMLKS